MLPSSQSGAYVCLRCQSQAARQLRHVSHKSRGSLRTFSSTARSFNSPTKENPNRKIYPHGKLRGKKGGQLRESSEVLPVNTLGKPAEIILLKDVDFAQAKTQVKHTATKEVQGPRKSSKKDVFELVEKGATEVDRGSTIHSIDEFRDTFLGRALYPGEVLSQRNYDKLVVSLSEGFKHSQLRQYASKKGSNVLNKSTVKKKQLPHSEWTRGITPSDERHIIIPRNTHNFKFPKLQLARLIVDKSWQVSPDSGTDVGEIDVYSAESFMQARNEYGSSILSQIAETRHVKMQALTEKILRITGNKEAAIAALRDISRKCISNHIEHLQLISKPLENFTKDPDPTRSQLKNKAVGKFMSIAARNAINELELNALRETTGTMAKFSKGLKGTPIKLSAYSPEQLEDAHRALYAMSNLSTRSHQHFISFPKPLELRNGISPDIEALKYHNRGTSWLRDGGANSREPQQPNEGPEHPPWSQTRTDNIVHRIRTGMAAESSRVATSPVLAEHIESDITSRLGFVYWDSQHPAAKRFTKPGGLFVPGITHLKPLFSTLSESATSHGFLRDIITFSFRHDPPVPNKTQSNSKEAGEVFDWEREPLPEIKFEFALGGSTSESGGEAENEPNPCKTYAVTVDRSLAVALPGRSIDFCVNERVAHHLNKENAEMQNVLSPAIAQMGSSISGDSRLRAPPSLSIPVPKQWFVQPNPPLPQYQAASLGQEHFRATYRFVGVEHRQVIPFTCGSQQFEVATVNGGRLGPKYTQLSMVTPKVTGQEVSAQGTQERRLSDAINRGIKMVELVDNGSKGVWSFKVANEQTLEVAKVVELEAEPEVDDLSEVHDAVVEEAEEEQQKAAASG